MLDALQKSYIFIDDLFKLIVEYGVLLLEGMGVAIILVTAIRCIVGVIRHKQENLRLKLAEGIAFALEFKLGSEVLRTALARELSELLIIGIVIALRALLTFLLHWEIKNEEKRPELRTFIDHPISSAFEKKAEKAE